MTQQNDDGQLNAHSNAFAILKSGRYITGYLERIVVVRAVIDYAFL